MREDCCATHFAALQFGSLCTSSVLSGSVQSRNNNSDGLAVQILNAQQWLINQRETKGKTDKFRFILVVFVCQAIATIQSKYIFTRSLVGILKKCHVNRSNVKIEISNVMCVYCDSCIQI